LISINFTLFVQIAHFLLLVWILNRILIRPMVKHLAAKEETLGQRRQEVDRLTGTAASRQQDYESRLKEIHSQASQEREEMLNQARHEAQRLRRESGREAKAFLEKARAEVAASVAEIRESLLAREDDLAEELSRVFLGRKA